jgi:hypothetical protein
MMIPSERTEDEDDEEAEDKYEYWQKGHEETTTMMMMKRPETSMNTDERPKDYDEEAGDKYLNVKIIMNMGTNDADKWLNVRGDCTANPNANPLFDTHEYEIEFTDGKGNMTNSSSPNK